MCRSQKRNVIIIWSLEINIRNMFPIHLDAQQLKIYLISSAFENKFILCADRHIIPVNGSKASEHVIRITTCTANLNDLSILAIGNYFWYVFCMPPDLQQ